MKDFPGSTGKYKPDDSRLYWQSSNSLDIKLSFNITKFPIFSAKISINCFIILIFFRRSGTNVVIAIFVIVAMSFVPAGFVVFLVTERSTSSKHLQFVCGLDPVIYWLSNYFWDMVCCMFDKTFLVLIIPQYNTHPYCTFRKNRSKLTEISDFFFSVIT